MVEDCVKCIVLFLMRGTSVVDKPTKAMSIKGTEFIQSMRLKANLVATVLKVEGEDPAVTLPRTAATFPLYSLAILKRFDTKIERPVTVAELSPHHIADIPKSWMCSLIYASIPAVSIEQVPLMGKILKTILKHGVLEGDVMNQQNKDLPWHKQTPLKKILETLNYARVAATGNRLIDSKKIISFLSSCLPNPRKPGC